jgi:ribose transport system substrate-binding protein
MKPRTVLSGFAAACCIAGAAACSSSSSPTGTSTQGSVTASGGGGSENSQVAQAQAIVQKYLSAPTQIPQTVSLPHVPPKGKTIIMLGNSEPTVVQGIAAVRAAAAALGWTFKDINYDYTNLATLQTAAMNALAFHPAGVVVTGVGESALSASTLAAYKSANIPIADVGGFPYEQSTSYPFNPKGVFIPVTVDQDYSAQGKLLADWFIADSNGRGKALMEHLSGFPVLNNFTDSKLSSHSFARHAGTRRST